VIEVDPRVLTSGSRLPVAGADLHAAPAIAGVGAPGRIVVVTQARAEECAGMGARTCRKDGVWVGVVLESPVITGETATVKVFVRVSRAPTEAEKARLQQSGRSQATIARFSEEAGSATLFQLSLISKNGMWSVASRRIIGQS
jgi:hypothetical protein